MSCYFRVITQMGSERVDASNMIRVDVSQNDFHDASACGNQGVDTVVEGLLLLFVGRAGIDDQNLV